MKTIRTLSALFVCLTLSAVTVAAVEAAPSAPPTVQYHVLHKAPMPQIIQLGKDGEQEEQSPAPGQVPGAGQNPGIPGLPPGAEPGPDGMVRVAPTPEMREKLYFQVWQMLGTSYVDESKLKDWELRATKYNGKLNSDADLDAALTELVESIGDRWTKYRSATDLVAQNKRFEDGFVPAGFILRRHADNAWHIDGLLYGSAAQQSLLKEGDIIVSLNGQRLDKLSEAEVLKLAIGKEGDQVKVVAVWDGKEHEVELTLLRPAQDKVMVRLLPNEILYMRLPTFESPELIQEFGAQLRKAYFEAKGQVTGICLDLRYNSGGLFDMSLKLSSMFLESGTITKATVHNGQSETVTEHKVRPMPQFAKRLTTEPHVLDFLNWTHNTPMVVLINGSTASASEVTTGALQDNGRAYVIGTHSFGKSVGFTINNLPNGGQLFVTTLKYLTPNGQDILDKGLQPDLVVDQPRGGTQDLALKAAHDYIVKTAARRFQQVQDAQQIVGKPASELQNSHNECLPDWLKTTIVLILVLAVVLMVIYFCWRGNKS